VRHGGEPAVELNAARAWLSERAALQPISLQEIAESERTVVHLQALGLDSGAQLAALLSPAFDGTTGMLEAMRKQWGDEVATLISSLHRLTHLGSQVDSSQEGDTPQRIETLRRMVLALAQDVRAVIIRLAAHLVRLESVAQNIKQDPDQYLPLGKALGDETLKIQAPLANRLGIWQLKWALEDLAFRMTDPQAYQQIARQLDEKRLERERFVNDTILTISAHLAQAGINGQVAGRPKHLFSIRNKMQAKGLRFDQLRDLRAFRVLVDTESQCYAVLGLLHDQWKPMAEEFDDYITRPKANGYQSLHTVLLDADDRPFEVQIRTHDMHHRAELGIAAHWKYKEAAPGQESQASYADKISWLRQMLDWSRGTSGQVRLSDDRVYALTPKARIIELPRGATPLDFAYHLHTEVGHRCRGAKLDGQMVPLTTPITTGQTVELMTVKQGKPSRDWMNPDTGYLKSARARQKVRAWFHAQDQAAGLVEVKPALDPAERGEPAVESTEASEKMILARLTKPRSSSKGQVLVVGVDRMLTALARCCKPAPPDEIVGFVTRGRGVGVHRVNCTTFARMAKEAPERVIQTAWGKPPEASDVRYLVDVSVVAKSREHLLRDLAEVLAREKIPLVRIDSFPKADLVTLAMTLQVTDGGQLNRALLMLRDLTGVASAQRA
jgi:GTP pyrophosphokinase